MQQNPPHRQRQKNAERKEDWKLQKVEGRAKGTMGKQETDEGEKHSGLLL
jgi:hypothetical protein